METNKRMPDVNEDVPMQGLGQAVPAPVPNEHDKLRARVDNLSVKLKVLEAKLNIATKVAQEADLAIASTTDANFAKLAKAMQAYQYANERAIDDVVTFIELVDADVTEMEMTTWERIQRWWYGL